MRSHRPSIRTLPPGPRTPDRRRRWALPIAAGAGFLAGLDTTAVNVALPDIHRDLAADLAAMQWVVNAFVLLSAALLVTAGNLSDRFGRRRVFVAGLLAFAVSSLACASSTTAVVLAAARAVQGGSAAVVTASGLAVLATLYPSGERGRAIGVYGAIAAASFVVGPLLGGALTDVYGWRSVFLVNVPVAALLALAARTVLPALPGVTGRARFDVAGVVTFTLGLGAVMYASIRAGDTGRVDVGVAVAAVTGLVALGAFVVVERRAADPVVDLRLFRDRTFAGAVATMALGAGAYFGMLVYLSLFLQGAQHRGALETGLVYLPAILPFMVVSPLAGRLLARVPGAALPTAGLVLIAGGLLLLVGVDDGSGLLGLAAGMAIAGLGTGLTVTPLTQLALDRASVDRAGMAAGVLQTARPVGVLVGVTVLGLVVPGQVDAAAFGAVAALAAGGAAVAALVAAVTIRPARERA